MKQNESKLFEIFGDLGRMDYADNFMGRVIETERQQWDIHVMHMNNIVEEANEEYLHLIGFYETEKMLNLIQHAKIRQGVCVKCPMNL